MSLQVTGSFKLTNGTYAINPEILMIPTLPYANILNLQAQVVLPISGSLPYPVPSNQEYYQVDNIYYNNIDLNILPTSSMENPYSALIDSLDQYVKSDLEVKQPDCTYNIG
jgi:hypothetical protein